MLTSFLINNIVDILKVVAGTGLIIWVVKFLVDHGTLKERDRRHNDEKRMLEFARNTAEAEKNRFEQKLEKIREEHSLDPNTLTDVDRDRLSEQETDYDVTLSSDLSKLKKPTKD